jgi:serine kinase of HPr protein (carbohydrate metabolism regulator)
MMMEEPTRQAAEADPGFAGAIHGTTVLLNGRAVMIRGGSGSGKSDLALRLIDRGAQLLSDDYTDVVLRDGGVIASTPPNIAGLIEVRGIGLVAMPHAAEAPLALIVALLPEGEAPPERYPAEPRAVRLCGQDVPLLTLRPFEASAPIKVELALDRPPPQFGSET